MMLFIQLNDLKKIARDRRDFKFFFRSRLVGQQSEPFRKCLVS